MTSYRELDADKTIATLHTLKNRIEERFPETGLAGVCQELCLVASETRTRTAWISQPHIPTRIVVGIIVLLSIGLIAVGASGLLSALDHTFGIVDMVAITESATNELVLVGAALLFMFGIEVRIKRTRALRVLHELRAISHVIDMHQLTKDPSRILNPTGIRTRSSPKRTLTAFQLTRYLDYCSEMLSLLGKMAALYAQSFPDPVVVAAVNDIETLTNGLSRKIWQKIMILDVNKTPASAPTDAPPDSAVSPSPNSDTPDPGE